jgi:hypothetical protein
VGCFVVAAPPQNIPSPNFETASRQAVRMLKTMYEIFYGQHKV